MNEYKNLELQVEELKNRIDQQLTSVIVLLKKVIQFQQRIIKCRERQTQLLGEKNGERS